MNPRRTKPPETVFETAAFDRSATPPRSAATRREGIRWFFTPRYANGSPQEPGFAQREAKNELKKRNEEEEGNTGETWFPPYE